VSSACDTWKVSMGCTKGGVVIDLVSGRPFYSIHTNKSDIMAQCWLNAASASTDATLILNGCRNGSLQLTDLRMRDGRGVGGGGGMHARASSYSSSSSPTKSASTMTFQMSSSICWLHAMKTHEQQFMAAAVDGSLCLYDLRRSASSTAFTSASSSSRWRNSANSTSTHASTPTSTPTPLSTPLLSFPAHVNSYSVIHPCLSACESWLFSGGADGVVRAWETRAATLIFEKCPIHTHRDGRPILDGATQPSAPMTASASASTAARNRHRTKAPVSIWNHVCYMDEFDTLLAASNDGVAALTLTRDIPI